MLKHGHPEPELTFLRRLAALTSVKIGMEYRIRMRRAAILTLIGVLVASGAMSQERLAHQVFGGFPTGSNQRAAAIGSYALGCGSGFVQLPETGPTWQAMRLSRNRNWGHPETIDYIRTLSSKVARLSGWKGLYVGDIGLPRGGPMFSGHRSHQMGLDVDIWMLPPNRLNLSRQEREDLSSISIRTADQTGLSKNWTRQHAQVLELAARDPRVDRIFVTAPAKIEMCKTARPRDKSWLQKIRPLFGHHYHFHVRLKCPEGSRHCKTQRPSVNSLSDGGNGCDEKLQWWVTGYLEQLKNPKPVDPNAPKRKGPRDYTMNDLPAQCSNVAASR